MNENGNYEEQTVRVTISLPKILLDEFDEKCRAARPRLPRSRRIQELIIGDIETAGEVNVLEQPTEVGVPA